MSEEVITLSEEKLRELCANWQMVFKLQDWEIEVHVLRVDVLGTKVGLGQCRANPGKRKAIIKLLHPDDYGTVAPEYKSGGTIDFEQERVLVHEILHIPFAAIDSLIGNGNANEVILEQAINSLDVPLVELVRSARAAAKLRELIAEEPELDASIRKMEEQIAGANVVAAA